MIFFTTSYSCATCMKICWSIEGFKRLIVYNFCQVPLINLKLASIIYLSLYLLPLHLSYRVINGTKQAVNLKVIDFNLRLKSCDHMMHRIKLE